jgi:hypothetical protein
MNKRIFYLISTVALLLVNMGITCGQTDEQRSSRALLGASPSFTSSSTEDLLDLLAKIEARRVASERFIRRGTLLSVIGVLTSFTAYYMYKYHYRINTDEMSRNEPCDKKE